MNYFVKNIVIGESFLYGPGGGVKRINFKKKNGEKVGTFSYTIVKSASELKLPEKSYTYQFA
jgi:uncharacterized protein YkuJ